MEITVLIGEMFWAFTLIFVVCEFGDNVSYTFSKIDYEALRLDWYSLPVNLWKMVPSVILYAQRPVYIQVFGSTACNRLSFKNVSSISISLHYIIGTYIIK